MIKNKKIYFFIIAVTCIFSNAFLTKAIAETPSKAIVDVYSSKQVSVDMIQKKYSDDFQKIANMMSSSDILSNEKKTEKNAESFDKIVSGIRKMGDFSYIGISPTVYSKLKNIYITVDLIDKDDKKRQPHFLSPPKKTLSDPDNLIKEWMAYEKTGMTALFNKKSIPVSKSCPAYHCLYGFEDQRVKKYQSIFDKLVPKNKAKLIKIARQEKDASKRAAAVYLLAHIKNGNELVKIVSPSMRDSSSQVRNSAMRVLGEALGKIPNVTFAMQSVVKAMNFPSASDRNKALYMANSLATQPRYARYLKAHAKQELISQLKMQQPNVHDLSYDLLKKISGKNFGERDYQAWEKWLNA